MCNRSIENDGQLLPFWPRFNSHRNEGARFVQGVDGTNGKNGLCSSEPAFWCRAAAPFVGMPALVHSGLAAGVFSKLAYDLEQFYYSGRAAVVELLLRCVTRAILFWLVFRVCCRAFFACALDSWTSSPARWFRVGGSQTAVNNARILHARSRRERFLFEQLYLARRVPCAEELEAVCRFGLIRGDPALVVEFASQPGPGLDGAGEKMGTANVKFSRGPRVVEACGQDAFVIQGLGGDLVPEGGAKEALSGTPTPPPWTSDASIRKFLVVFPFPFGAIDLAEIHSRVWPPATPRAFNGAGAAHAIERARARHQAQNGATR